MRITLYWTFLAEDAWLVLGKIMSIDRIVAIHILNIVSRSIIGARQLEVKLPDDPDGWQLATFTEA